MKILDSECLSESKLVPPMLHFESRMCLQIYSYHRLLPPSPTFWTVPTKAKATVVYPILLATLEFNQILKLLDAACRSSGVHRGMVWTRVQAPLRNAGSSAGCAPSRARWDCTSNAIQAVVAGFSRALDAPSLGPLRVPQIDIAHDKIVGHQDGSPQQACLISLPTEGNPKRTLTQVKSVLILFWENMGHEANWGKLLEKNGLIFLRYEFWNEPESTKLLIQKSMVFTVILFHFFDKKRNVFNPSGVDRGENTGNSLHPPPEIEKLEKLTFNYFWKRWSLK